MLEFKSGRHSRLRSFFVNVMLIVFFALFFVGIGSLCMSAIAQTVPVERPPLADRAVAFMASRPGGDHRVRREEDWFRELAGLVERLTDGTPPSPELVLAVAFRESSWKPTVLGALEERGLLQLHPRWLRQMGLQPGEDPLDPEVNLRVGIRFMRESFEECGDLERGLVRYASGACGRPGFRERLVLRWAEQMR